MRCLLIDDDIPTVEALLSIVNWSDYRITEVMTANNIHEAKQIVESGVPDLIICDIEMPRGTGIDMIKWVREQSMDCGFIFLTCHESFEFASTAISYDADSYLVKPLDKQKLEAALYKSIETLRQKRMLGEYSKLGMTWLKNKDHVEKSFWRDVLTEVISPRKDLIQGEIKKRDLSLSIDEEVVLVLVSVPHSQIVDEWDDSIFRYALANLSSEILFQQVNHGRVISYQSNSSIYITGIVTAGADFEKLKENTELLIHACKQLLKCTATCYIGENVAISGLARSRMKLEQLDASNIIFRGKIHFQNHPFQYNISERYTLNVDQFTMLFVQKEKVQIVNRLKMELETLARQNKLDSITLHSIREDFLQVVYSFLSANYIQANRLFADDTAQQALQNAENSVFDFMKWAHYVTDITIESVKAALQSEGIVERAKRFIHENYNKDLSREDVAASVYLTADYLAKAFKHETGLTIKEYLNECRIKAAKRMLLESAASIGFIATETGFDTISYFSTVFKKLTGEAPNAYRSKHKFT